MKLYMSMCESNLVHTMHMLFCNLAVEHVLVTLPYRG